MWDSVTRRCDLRLVACVSLLVCATINAALVWSASPAAAARPGPPFDSLQNGKNPMTVRDDGCYSSITSVSSITSMVGGASFGLVNAITNLPVYDWDQNPNDARLDMGYEAYRYANSWGRGALRNELGARGVGYAGDFDFDLTPIPNLLWMGKYFGTQLPYDIAQIASFAGGPNLYAQANPSIGSANNPFIANPFIYQQTSAMFPNGFPRVQVVSGLLPNTNDRNESWLSNSFDINKMTQNLTNTIGAADTMLKENQGRIQDVNNNVKNGDILSLVANVKATINSTETVSDKAIKTLIQSPILGPSTVPYNVNQTRPADNCYEFPTSSKPPVPAYAFSVVDTVLPITIPGWLYSPITLIDTAVTSFRPTASASGVTFYPPGSVNGKDILDCYGRGVQPIVTGSPKYKFRDFAPVIGYAGVSVTQFNIPVIGQVNAVAQLGPVTALINIGVATAVQAAGAAADSASVAAGGPPGVGQQVARVALGLPSAEIKFETYTSGIVFAFSVPSRNGKGQQGIRGLPTVAANRAVDYTRSNDFDVNYRNLLGDDGRDHAASQNGKQFNPNLFAVLKEPYELDAGITVDNQPNSPRDRLDGKKNIKITVDNKKTGFQKGNLTRNDPDNTYRRSPQSNGGPTFDDNEGANGRSFVKASVYRIVMKPGVIPNAIDVDKKAQPSTASAYKGAQLTGGSESACSFFRQKLQDGDTSPATGGLASSIPGVANGNANFNRSEFTAPDSFQCDFAVRKSDGVQMRDIDVRMGDNESLQALGEFEENIPAETDPGTKYCYAVFYDNYNNDIKYNDAQWWGQRYNGTKGAVNYNPAYAADRDKRFLSKAKCVISGYKPSLQVRGGDLMVNGGVYTGTNRKDFLASGTDPKELRTYGSWVEYGVIASGPVVNLGSGAAYRTGLTPSLEELGALTFANARVSNKPAYGKYSNTVDSGFTRVAKQFTAMSSQARTDFVTRTSIDLTADIQQSGVYRLRSGPVDIRVSGVLPANRSIILLAQQDTVVNIANNVTVPTQYGSIGEISQVVIAPATDTARYTININHDVQQVDAWLLTPNGTINTCYTGEPSSSIENKPRAGNRCHNELLVNGPVATNTLLLRRSGGQDQGSETNIQQSVPAETFNLRPDAYIWAANYVDNASKKYITTNALDLPPRY